MATPTQMSTSIPWYRTRLFWGSVYVVFISWSLFFFTLIYAAGESLMALLRDLSIAFGGGLFGMFGRVLGPEGGVVGVVLFFILSGFLIYKTFEKARVHIAYPLTFSALFILGEIAGVLLQAI